MAGLFDPHKKIGQKQGKSTMEEHNGHDQCGFLMIEAGDLCPNVLSHRFENNHLGILEILISKLA